MNLQRFLILFISVVLPCVNAQQPFEAPFTRVTNSVVGSELASSVVGAWGDFDNNGWIDLFVANRGSGVRNWLFHNTNGVFTKVTTGPVVTDLSASPFNASWVDYDNDGWVDLTVANHDGATPNQLYRNRGDGSFVKLSAASVGSFASDRLYSHSVSWADYDNDGNLDLFVGNGSASQSYRDAMYRNDGTGFLILLTNNPIVNSIASSVQGAWADYDNDGDMDLFVSHTLGQTNSLFRNDGPAGFTDVSASAGFTLRGDSLGAAWGDYDNDGDLDLFVANARLSGAATTNFFYTNKGDGSFERIITGAFMEAGQFVSCSWVDYDNDGWLDLFVTHLGQGSLNPRNRLYRNLGNGQFSKIVAGRLVTDPGPSGSTAWADYDNDGFLDVFVSMGTLYTSVRSALYHNNANDNCWIKVRCVGNTSNRSAIGAKVRVKARIGGSDRWQSRQIIGSEGWVTFSSLDVVIGLGDASQVDTLRIEWPSGTVQEFNRLAVKQTITVVESSEFLILKGEADEITLSIKGPAQQKYQIDASDNLINWEPFIGTTVTNFDRIATTKFPSSSNRYFFRATAR